MQVPGCELPNAVRTPIQGTAAGRSSAAAASGWRLACFTMAPAVLPPPLYPAARGLRSPAQGDRRPSTAPGPSAGCTSDRADADPMTACLGFSKFRRGSPAAPPWACFARRPASSLTDTARSHCLAALIVYVHTLEGPALSGRHRRDGSAQVLRPALCSMARLAIALLLLLACTWGPAAAADDVSAGRPLTLQPAPLFLRRVHHRVHTGRGCSALVDGKPGGGKVWRRQWQRQRCGTAPSIVRDRWCCCRCCRLTCAGGDHLRTVPAGGAGEEAPVCGGRGKLKTSCRQRPCCLAQCGQAKGCWDGASHLRVHAFESCHGLLPRCAGQGQPPPCCTSRPTGRPARPRPSRTLCTPGPHNWERAELTVSRWVPSPTAVLRALVRPLQEAGA